MPKNLRGKPFCLLILDGWGLAPAWAGNAITQARTPNYDKAWRLFPSCSLLASGAAVGLPVNAPGNSEAGHLNIGSGRVVHQDVALVDEQISNGAFFKNEVLLGAIRHAKKNHSNIHLMGLLSKVGTHSHVRHLYALLRLMKDNNFSRVYIHLFSDGRDSDPTSGIETAEEVEKQIKEIGVGRIASISGRYFAMDRDNRFGRVSRTYNLLVRGEGNCYESSRIAFSQAYAQAETDEFIDPRLIASKTNRKATIDNNDAVIFFNLRGDRTKELTRAFLDKDVPEMLDRKKLKNLYFVSFVMYEDDKLSKRAFAPEKIESPLAAVWSREGLRQYHTAETEKYPHVTYFFNGGIEKPFRGETRVMIPSPKDVKTYDYKPEMSAKPLTESIMLGIKSGRHDGFIINYANTDMVGHSGNLGSTIKAAECVDNCVGKILSRIFDIGGLAIIMADHGNAEQMVNPRSGDRDTEHTTNPVPFIVVGKGLSKESLVLQNNGILGSVAPTILDLMNIPKPLSMLNQSLIIKTESK